MSKYRYVLLDEEDESILLDTTDKDKVIDTLASFLSERDTLYKIETHYGKIVNSFDNIMINKEILKILKYQPSKD